MPLADNKSGQGPALANYNPSRVRPLESTVSVVDLVCEVEKATTVEEVNRVFKEASRRSEFQGIFGVEDAPVVSSDYIGNSFSSIVDSSLTMVNEKLVKVIAWYDNEWGYACRLADFAEYVGKKK